MYDKAAVQDIFLPESHPFGCRLHEENCSEIKGKSNSAAHQATVYYPFYNLSVSRHHTVQKLSSQEFTYSLHGKEEGDLLSIYDRLSY